MPQQATISDESVKAFQDLDENGQRTALAAMSPEAKQALLAHLSVNVDPERGASEAKSVAPRTWRDKFKSMALEGASWLPSIAGAAGGTVAGITSGPEAAPVGAVLGGTAGKAGQHLVEGMVYGNKAPQRTLGQEATEDIVEGEKQGTYEAAGGVAAKGAEALAHSPAAERWAARPLNRMLRVPKEGTPYSRDNINPGIALAREKGIPVLTGRYGMRKAIAEKVAEHATTRDAEVVRLTRGGTQVDLQAPVEKVFDDAMLVPQKYRKIPAQKNVAKTLKTMKRELTTGVVPGAFTPGQGMMSPPRPIRNPRLQNMPLDRALEFRDELNEMMKGYKADTDEPVRKTLQKAYIAVTDAIHQAAPSIAKDDEAMHQLIYGRGGMEGRVEHLERGTVETSAGKGGEEKVAGMISRHLPTRTVPWYMTSSKIRKGITKAGSTPAKREVIKQAPRVLAGSSDMTPPPDDEE